MIKLLLVVALAVLLFDCGRKQSPAPPRQPTPQPTLQPIPQPTPEPTIAPAPSPAASPVPAAIATPTPLPVPAVDLTPFLHEQGGRVVTVNVSGVEDVGAVVNAADSFDGPGKLIIKGGGPIKSQVMLKHDSEWSGDYSCETQTLEGCVILRDNTKHEGKGAVFYEPTFIGAQPAITVFQTPASRDNQSKSFSVTIKGFKIVGRQEKTDGGMRQAISFGNCHNCAAIENELTGIASIGIQFGGSAALGNHAENGLVYRNKIRRFAAAAIALVNFKGVVVAENDIAEPGRRPGEPGGISAIDIETNNTDDCGENAKIFNNIIRYGRSNFGGIAGNGILGQNVYQTKCSGGLLIANNLIDGWEGGGDPAQFVLASGLYFVGNWPDSLITRNVVIRAMHAGVTLYGSQQLTLDDNLLVSSGSGGIYSIMLYGAQKNTFKRTRIEHDPRIPGSVYLGTWCREDSIENVFQAHSHQWPAGVCTNNFGVDKPIAPDNPGPTK